MVINNILTEMLRLAQVTSGFIAWDATIDLSTGALLEPKSIEFLQPNPKAEVMGELLAERYCKPREDEKEFSMDQTGWQLKDNYEQENKMIVWACFTPDIATIKAVCKRLGVVCVTFTGSTSDFDREAAVSSFNKDPMCKVFIGNAAAGGVGVNLRGYDPDQDTGLNCDTVVYYSQNWSMVHRKQSEDRAHRRGTRCPVMYVDLVVPGTIDEEIRRRVTGKAVAANQVQDIREILERVLGTRPTIEEGN